MLQGSTNLLQHWFEEGQLSEAAVTIFQARRVITMTGKEPEAFAVLG